MAGLAPAIHALAKRTVCDQGVDARRKAGHDERESCVGASMSKERLYLFDTTLRDGAQTNGVDFTLADKLAIAAMLDELGIDYVEGGYPGANPTDTELFAEPRGLRATFTAFGMTRRPGRSTSNDPGLAALLDAKAGAICFVAKSWDYHVRVALETTLEENLASIRDSVRAARQQGREVLLDCEHFFDGYKANPSYALACAKAAHEEGARWVVLCDTNGGTLPHEVEAIVAEVVRAVPGDHVGIHAHNDTEQAVANSFAAVRAGVRQIQGTLNGLGERCGNANLVSIIPTLKLKPEFADRFETGVSDQTLQKLAHVSHELDERLNRAPNRHAPYVGESAFATKAGIHASAIAKDPATYEHVVPEATGNRRKVLVSDQAGKSNVLAELERIGLKVDKDDARVARLLDEVKLREAIGYAYEAADASFELLARRMLGTVPKFFDVTYFDVKVEQRSRNGQGHEMLTTAVVKVKVGGETLISAAEGNGPVNALDVALRKDLGQYQKFIEGLKLTDYRVRILNTGTEAVTRVLIESEDETGEHWTTIGVSPNIIDASFQALMDSIVYKLVKAGATA
jgi:2-isopropylmalate synthase